MADKKTTLIIAANNQTKAAFTAVQASLKNIKKTSSGLVASMRQNWLAIAAAVTGAVVAINKALDAIEVAAALQQQKTALNILAAQFGETADTIVDKMKAVTANNLSLRDSIEIASNALNQGFNPQQVIELSEVFATLTRITGDDLSDALKRVISQVVRGRESFASLSVGLIDVAEMIKELGIENTKANRSMVLLNEIIARGQIRIEELGGATATLAESLAGLRNIFADTKDEIALFFLPIVAQLAQLFLRSIEIIFRYQKAVSELGLTLAGIPVLGRLIDADKIQAEIARIEQSIQRFNARANEMQVAIDNVKNASAGGILSPDTIPQLAVVNDSMSKLNDTFQKTIEAIRFENALIGLDEFDIKILRAERSANKLKEQFKEIPGALNEIDEEFDKVFANIEKQRQASVEATKEIAVESIESMPEDFKETFSVTLTLAEEVAGDMANAFDELFFSVLKGDLDDLEDLFRDFGNAILRDLSSSLSSGFGDLITGGFGALFGGNNSSADLIDKTLNVSKTNAAIPGFSQPQFASASGVGQSLTVNVPVNVAGNNRLASDLRSGIESTVIDIIRRQL